MEPRGTGETTDNNQKVGRQRGQKLREKQLSPCGSNDENQTAREGRKGHRGGWTRTGPRREARRGQGTGTLTETRRESSNPTKISPPPKRPGQCPHFREARLLTANSTSWSWQRRMRQTGDAQNVTVTYTDLAACAESRRTLRLCDRQDWHYGHLTCFWPRKNLSWTAEGSTAIGKAMAHVLGLTFAFFGFHTWNTCLEIMTPMFLSP